MKTLSNQVKLRYACCKNRSAECFKLPVAVEIHTPTLPTTFFLTLPNILQRDGQGTYGVLYS